MNKSIDNFENALKPKFNNTFVVIVIRGFLLSVILFFFRYFEWTITQPQLTFSFLESPNFDFLLFQISELSYWLLFTVYLILILTYSYFSNQLLFLNILNIRVNWLASIKEVSKNSNLENIFMKYMRIIMSLLLFSFRYLWKAIVTFTSFLFSLTMKSTSNMAYGIISLFFILIPLVFVWGTFSTMIASHRFVLFMWTLWLVHHIKVKHFELAGIPINISKKNKIYYFSLSFISILFIIILDLILEGSWGYVSSSFFAPKYYYGNQLVVVLKLLIHSVLISFIYSFISYYVYKTQIKKIV